MFGGILDAKKAGRDLDPNYVRALALRDQCVEIIRLINGLPDRPVSKNGLSDGEQETINKLISKLYVLKEVIITPEAHKGQAPEMFINNPLGVAEYASSVLMTTIEENIWPMDIEGHILYPAILNPASRSVILRDIRHVDRFIGERMGTTTENIPNH